ncbi:putative toxin-antitoxin system toxin component, PIN family, partial [Balneolaceae bacterium ANBcel3]|nr:putative toxin-antitoxin system toxin component, PIN family [Balneolaceae bacterium ANBcel3]
MARNIMRVFANTNFLVSAFASRGLSADVFQLILTKHELQTGEFNLDELRRILIERFKLPSQIAQQAENLLRQHHIEPIPKKPSEFELGDFEDRWVLASALNAKAHILITGDKDLLDISNEIEETRILN